MPRRDTDATRLTGREAQSAWADTTPHPERPTFVADDLPVGGSALDRLLAAAASLAFAALLLRLFV